VLKPFEGFLVREFRERHNTAVIRPREDLERARVGATYPRQWWAHLRKLQHGQIYVVDIQRNFIVVATHVDLEDRARELGVLKANEVLEE
jgi:hypothetical protein